MSKLNLPKYEQIGTWVASDPHYKELALTHYEDYIGKISVNNRRGSDGKYRNGFWFYSAKKVTKFTTGNSVTVWSYGRPEYTGSFIAYRGGGEPGHPNDWSYNGQGYINLLRYRGAEAWDAMRPDKPDFSLAQSVLELKDLVKPLKNRVKWFVDKVSYEQALRQAAGRSLLSKTGEYWLAIQFGWLPVLQDVLNFMHAQNSGQHRVEQLIRDEGKPVRRRRNLPSEPTADSYSNGTYGTPWQDWMRPAFVTSSYGSGKANISVKRSTQTKVWCVGAFRWYLPPGPRTVEWHKRLLRRNIDVGLTPATVYNLVPWSWLVDYFTTLGSFMNNISAGMSDRLVADYAHVMQETKHSCITHLSQSVITSKDGRSTQVTASVEEITTQKVRYYATPFGFGMKQSDLSPMQMSILGAIGLSRLP